MGLGSGGGTFSCSSDMGAACKIYFEDWNKVSQCVKSNQFD